MTQTLSKRELYAVLNNGRVLSPLSKGYMLSRAVYAYNTCPYHNGNENSHTVKEMFNSALLAVLASAELGDNKAIKLMDSIRELAVADTALVEMYEKLNLYVATMPLDTIEGLGFSILLHKPKFFLKVLRFNSPVSAET